MVEKEVDAFSIKMSTKQLRVAVIGNVDAGKSTLIGTIKSGILDNGRGQTRLMVMKHQHEIDTGRTSTVTAHLIGYDEDGQPINKSINQTDPNVRMRLMSEFETAANANNLVYMVDLAGHEKYLKTTIHGISSGMLDYALVLVNASHGPNQVTLHHISLSVAFGVPFIIVLTKIDSSPEHALKNTKEEVAKIIRSSGVQKRPYHVKQSSDIAVVLDKMHAIVPIVSISSVSGVGIDLIHALLSNLPKRRRHQHKASRDFEFLIDNIYNMIGTGTVVSGFVNAGSMRVGETVYVGPLNDGTYMKAGIKSAQISRTNVNSIIAGNSAGLALVLPKDKRKMLRKGMVVLSQPLSPSRIFEADMVIIKGHGVDGTTIKVGYETMAHILQLKQHVRVEKIQVSNYNAADEVVLRQGGRARVTFRFLKHVEYIRKGMRVCFRDGHVRGIGIITLSN